MTPITNLLYPRRFTQNVNADKGLWTGGVNVTAQSGKTDCRVDTGIIPVTQGTVYAFRAWLDNVTGNVNTPPNGMLCVFDKDHVTVLARNHPPGNNSTVYQEFTARTDGIILRIACPDGGRANWSQMGLYTKTDWQTLTRENLNWFNGDTFPK